MSKHYCDTELCGEEISENCGTRGGLPICQKCRSVYYYWKGKSSDELKERKKKLEFWGARLDYLSPQISKLVRQARERVQSATHRAVSSLHH